MLRPTKDSDSLTSFEKFVCYMVIMATVKRILKKQIFKKNK